MPKRVHGFIPQKLQVQSYITHLVSSILPAVVTDSVNREVCQGQGNPNLS